MAAARKVYRQLGPSPTEHAALWTPAALTTTIAPPKVEKGRTIVNSIQRGVN